MIEEFVGDGRRFGLSVRYSHDGPVLRGTAGALLHAASLLGESFLVIYGDSYLPCQYRLVERAFLESGKEGLMTVFRNEGRFDRSNVEFAGGKIIAYDKPDRTPAMLHIDYGLGAFHARSLERIRGRQFYDLATFYQDLLREGQLAGFEVTERFYEVGSIEGIRGLTEHLRDKYH
jgi:NDP-sugar pyrophosphorylase family protein